MLKRTFTYQQLLDAVTAALDYKEQREQRSDRTAYSLRLLFQRADLFGDGTLQVCFDKDDIARGIGGPKEDLMTFRDIYWLTKKGFLELHLNFKKLTGFSFKESQPETSSDQE